MNTITITEPKIERFRIIPSQRFSLPEGMNIEDYKIVGYLQGERVNNREPLSVDLFDGIQYISTSENDMEGSQHIHCIGYREREKKHTVLILKKEQQ